MGLRLDREDIDTQGFAFFDPRAEKRRSISIVESLCADARRVAQTSGQSNSGAVCDVVGRIPGQPPVGGALKYTLDGQTPESLRRFDSDGDGVFDSGTDGAVWFDPYTSYPTRLPEGFEIQNLDLAPRLSVAWDPWADGKTKLFGTWGRYSSRILLNAVDDEMGPDVINFTFQPDPTAYKFLPGMLSEASSSVTVYQVDRDLRTPFTDVLTLGIERELAPEWSAKVTYTQRLAWEMLQDSDINHLECSGFPEAFGIDERYICPSFTDATGKVHLSDDLFGEVGTGNSNQAPDLYIVSPNFNQVLRISNSNTSRYRSLALELNRRLHRNWQSQLSYTWSKIFGQAEDFQSGLGDDPSTIDDEEGYLNYDQRHRVVFIATTNLPRDVEVGATIIWESGTPYSVISQTVDSDDVGNVSIRTFFPSEQRNDQRNDGFWGVDTKVVKRFTIKNVAASASLAVNNLLNDDSATLGAWRSSSISGVQLVQGPQGLRRFGRFWELGFTMAF
jgi:hypothetical protein